MTTSSSDFAPNFRKRKKKDKPMPVMFRGMPLTADLGPVIDDVVEAGTGGKDYLAALFANKVLGDRSSRKGGADAETTIHKGAGKYSNRKYRIKKKGGGQYEVERVKR